MILFKKQFFVHQNSEFKVQNNQTFSKINCDSFTSDCFLSIEVLNCIACCRNSTCSPLYSAPDVTTCSFRCYAAFKTFLQGQIGDSRLFFASDYIDMAMELCRISFAPQAIAMNLYEDDCSSIKQFTINKEVARPFKRTKAKNHRITNQPKTTEKKIVNSVNNNTRLFGSSIYPLTRVADANPWLCSLRTRGFRGRHRCGVTLLSGGVILRYTQAILQRKSGYVSRLKNAINQPS